VFMYYGCSDDEGLSTVICSRIKRKKTTSWGLYAVLLAFITDTEASGVCLYFVLHHV